MANTKNRTVTSVVDWRARFKTAREQLKELEIGQQMVIAWVVEQQPLLDTLTNFSRWHNTWNGRVADVELIQLVEKAADHFQKKAEEKKRRRPSTGRLKPPPSD